MPAAPPAAETKKPATPPPAKDDKAKATGPESNGAAQPAGGASDKAGAKDAAGGQAGAKDQAGAAQSGAKSGAGAGPAAGAANPAQQRFDRMAVRAKMAVSEPGDAVEREADQVAERISRKVDPRGGAAAHGAAGHAAGGQGAKPVEAKPPPPAAAPPIVRAKDPHPGESADDPLSPDNQQAPSPAKPGAKGEATRADIQQQRGQGEPLDAGIRSKMEREFSHDLSQVRIHHDARSNDLCRSLGALAFTTGSDIFFAAGRYQPGNPAGLTLLAHELTHVVQQQDAGPMLARKLDPDMPANFKEKPGGDAAGKLAELGKLEIPGAKARHLPNYQGKLPGNLKRKRGYDRGSPNQVDKWNKGVQIDEAKIRQRLSARGLTNVPADAGTKFKLTVGTDKKPKAKSLKQLQTLLKIPTWTKTGKVPGSGFQVDHIIELQVSGENGTGTGNSLENMELLDQPSNSSSGGTIRASIYKKVDAYLAEFKPAPKRTAFLKKHDLVFESVAASLGAGSAQAASAWWTLAEIKDALPLDQISPAPPSNDEGSDTEFLLLSSAGGVVTQRFSHTAGAGTFNVSGAAKSAISGLEIDSVSVNANAEKGSGDVGSVAAKWKLPAKWQPASPAVTLALAGDGKYRGFPSKLGSAKLEFAHLSPVTFDEIEIEDGQVSADGDLTPSIKLFKTPIKVALRGEDIRFSVDYGASDLDLSAGPLSVDSAAVSVFYSVAESFGVGGELGFSVKNLGEGNLQASFSQGGGIALAGSFDVATDLFDTANVSAKWSEKDGFGATGKLAVTEPGKIKGLKSASLDVKYEKAVFSATGDVVPDIPGLKAASLSVTYANEQLQIKGKLGLDDKVPGVQAADINVELTQGDAGWSVAANGSVTPKLPALKGAVLSFSYKDGFVLMEGEFGIDKGPVSGKFKAGVTNGTVDDKGKRTDGGSGTKFTVFGSAEVDAIFIKDKLAGKLKLRLLSDGSTRVGGDLKVGDFDVFPQIPKDGGEFLNKEINSPRIPLPGAGFSVGSMSIGVTFWASGHVKAHASVGPGKMSGITLSVAEFDPGQIDLNKLEVGGKANFAVQGDAGIELGADVNVGLSAAVVDLIGSLGITAEVGIPKGTNILSAATTFTYSQANGLNLGATCNLDISPSLTFKLKGGFSAKLNLYVDTVTIWHKDWTLAQANYQLPIGITANGALSYNSKSNKLSVDPASAIKVKTPEFKSDDFMRILTGAPAPDKVENVDKEGKPVDGDNQPKVTPKVTPKRDAGAKAAAKAAPASVDVGIVHRLGGGEPLDLSMRGFFEQELRTDLTRVRIHRGPSAVREAEKLSAKAFTVGEHIAFAEGQYQPETPEGKQLLAHELAHVVQQSGGVARQVMRVPNGGATPAPAAAVASPASAAAPASATATPTTAPATTPATARGPITLPALNLPELKYGAAAENAHCKAAYDAALAANVERPAGYRRADVDSQQRTLWTGATPAATLRSGLATKVPGLDLGKVYVAVPRSLTLAGAGSQVIVGNPNELALALRQPRWDRLGAAEANPFEIDHMIELQIGGPAYDRLNNLELLERSANGASGRAIDATLDAAFASYAASPAAASLPAADRTAEVLKRQYRVRYAGFSAHGAPAAGKRWSLPEVQAAKPAEGLHIYDPSNLLGGAPTDPNAILRPWPTGVDATRFTGSPSLLVVYASPRGGEPRQVPLQNGQPLNPAAVLAGWLPGLEVGALGLTLTGAADGPIGQVRGRLNHAQLAAGAKIDIDIPIKRRRGLANAGVLDTELLLERLRELLRASGVTALSPVSVDEVDVQPGIGLVVSGHVQPTIEMLRNVSLDFQLRGNELIVSKTFQGGDIALGGPLRIDGSDLTVRLGTRSGLQIDGGVAFSINRLGQGTLRGAGRSEGFAVAGRFDFDPSLFDADAHIALAYQRGADAPDGKLSGSGSVAIGPGKVRGIRRATVQAAFDGPQRSLNGSAELDIPGVESATLGVQFTPEGGTEISGSARFRDRPGIRNGTLNATLTQAANGRSLAATGGADASFAGINARLDASYRDGLFMFAADAPFAIGSRVSGNLRVGVTNGQVDDQGRLLEGAAPAAGGAGELRPFGNGTVNLRLTDWLGGGIGIRVRPSGELLISGRIGIPAPVTVFEQYPAPERATRTLFQMPTVSVPLIGLSVGSTVVGVALTINGRVNGFAHVGPGRLTQTELRVEDFNPAQPDSLHVTGDGEFDLPAEAGVSASLDAGVSLGAAIITATAGLNVAAAASLHADVRPHVALDWRAATGLHLHADLSASLSPRLAFDLNGYAEVVANAFVTTFTLWRKEWNLAHREIGSNLALRFNAPVDYYSDGRGAVFDPAAVQFEVPSLNAETLGMLLNQQGGSERVERAARQ